MKNRNWNIILLLLAIGVVIVSLLWGGNAEFGGTDNKAVDIIEASNYRPWFDYILAPSSPVVESFLFSLQAAIGAGILFYCVGYFVGSKSKMDERRK
ncbi:cobalt/nickel transport protein [Balneicella halophila]|uniref:Cobalt transport protein CbiN n=1 Tax=Balneicella halophila TaxID=1537566 RepID=A0A7L4UQX1_BALHA|nr:energy-coupling factor ABC transporter substrate-binding protein [Balneicella halophila]PVX52166.1 cobalt/nickel transport protein [Balneicella halophila]